MGGSGEFLRNTSDAGACSLALGKHGRAKERLGNLAIAFLSTQKKGAGETHRPSLSRPSPRLERRSRREIPDVLPPNLGALPCDTTVDPLRVPT